ncbi:hypothetical protein Apau_1656 [Aminomonas paucivorans DSM 12260]|uniref:Uncharacterized protein n=1 Tax=Aminomonas paucivorans DSM 12260 TaxID=584708 RepID=E3CUU9_9BACT|nr:hypothetical protein Apau_1656 [Aminomonas paucivorans DSM 12260]
MASIRLRASGGGILCRSRACGSAQRSRIATLGGPAPKRTGSPSPCSWPLGVGYPLRRSRGGRVTTLRERDRRGEGGPSQRRRTGGLPPGPWSRRLPGLLPSLPAPIRRAAPAPFAGAPEGPSLGPGGVRTRPGESRGSWGVPRGSWGSRWDSGGVRAASFLELPGCVPFRLREQSVDRGGVPMGLLQVLPVQVGVPGGHRHVAVAKDAL